jgi:hypothetical protein
MLATQRKAIMRGCLARGSLTVIAERRRGDAEGKFLDIVGTKV